MGGDVSFNAHRPKGIFYLETNAEPPFAISDTNYFNKIEFAGPTLTDMLIFV